MLLVLRRGASDRGRLLPSSSFLSFSSSALSSSTYSSPELLDEPQAVIIALGGNVVSIIIEVSARDSCFY